MGRSPTCVHSLYRVIFDLQPKRKVDSRPSRTGSGKECRFSGFTEQSFVDGLLPCAGHPFELKFCLIFGIFNGQMPGIRKIVPLRVAVEEIESAVSTAYCQPRDGAQSCAINDVIGLARCPLTTIKRRMQEHLRLTNDLRTWFHFCPIRLSRPTRVHADGIVKRL